MMSFSKKNHQCSPLIYLELQAHDRLPNGRTTVPSLPSVVTFLPLTPHPRHKPLCMLGMCSHTDNDQRNTVHIHNKVTFSH